MCRLVVRTCPPPKGAESGLVDHVADDAVPGVRPEVDISVLGEGAGRVVEAGDLGEGVHRLVGAVVLRVEEFSENNAGTVFLEDAREFPIRVGIAGGTEEEDVEDDHPDAGLGKALDEFGVNAAVEALVAECLPHQGEGPGALADRGRDRVLGAAGLVDPKKDEILALGGGREHEGKPVAEATVEIPRGLAHRRDQSSPDHRRQGHGEKHCIRGEGVVFPGGTGGW